MQQISFGGRALSGPTGGAYSAPPDPLTGLMGTTSKGRGRGGKGGWCPHMTCLHDAPGNYLLVSTQYMNVTDTHRQTDIHTA